MNKLIVKDLLFTIAILLCITLIDIPYMSMLFAAIVVIIYAFSNEYRFKSIGFHRPASWLASFVQSLFLATVIVLLVVFIIRPAVEYITQSSVDITVFEPLEGNIELLFSFLLIGWVIGGISEELIFRGFFLNKIQEYIPGSTGMILSIILPSILFGLLHDYQGIAGQIQTGIIGAMLAGIYLISGRRLILCIMTHGLVNIISFTAIYLGYF